MNGSWISRAACWGLSVVAAVVASVPMAAALELPAIFADHMVLQRDMPVPVWGKAEPGQRVAVFLDDKLLGDTSADEQGNWRIDLPAMPASDQPKTMTIASGAGYEQEDVAPDSIRQIKDILVGDVWHCAGQSNMSWLVRNSNDAEAEIAAGDHPQIRLFRAPHTSVDTPQFTTGGTWKVASPQTVGGFSAVGYFFARQIQTSQGVPIGLFDTSWGGASAEAYTPLDSLNQEPVTRPYVANYERLLAEFLAKPEADRAEQKSAMPLQQIPGALWNGMIHPVAPFAHRGVLWYQGETNAWNSIVYRTLLPMMIEDWRAHWDQPGEARDTPFLIVQLANFKAPDIEPPASDNWAEMRDAQAFMPSAVPNAHVTTAMDIGDANDIHPRNKQDVGRRLARLAEHHVYGDESVVPVGPTFRKLGQAKTTWNDGVRGVVIEFDYAEGLTTSDGQPVRGFAVRRVGSEGPWVWAQTSLSDNRVLLQPPEGMTGPFEVRYAYSMNPADGPQGVNLVNGEGLPAMPFRTDPVPAK